MFKSNGMIIGVDEVGKGSWAGPMLVVAFAAPVTWRFDVKDSKKYTTPKARKKVYERLQDEDRCTWCVRYKDSRDIDEVGMGAAHRAAIAEAIEVCLTMMEHTFPGLPERIIVDGDEPQPFEGVECIPKADALFPQVSAASVIAKVLHDDKMIMEAIKYPGYDFEHNMGYHSEKHIKGLTEHGLTPIHRLSFNPMKDYLSVPVTGLSSTCGPAGPSEEDSGDACATKPALGYGRGSAGRSGKARKGARGR